MIRSVTLGLLLFSLGGCSSSDEPGAALPTGPTVTVPAQPPGGTAGPRLSGVIFENINGGRRPLPASRVHYTLADGTIDVVVADQEGRYTVASVPEGSRVRITAFSDAARSGVRFQRLGASVTIFGDTTLDVELVTGDTRGPIYDWPTLSGVVYRETAAGRLPVAHTTVYYGRLGAPLYDVYLETDAQGHFEFGRVPLGQGRLGASNCNDQAHIVPVAIAADTVADVDVTALFSTCPGVPY